MLRRLGDAGIALDAGDTTTRGTVLRRATPHRLRDLIRLNLAGLDTVLRSNASRGSRFCRLSSGLIPFVSHPVNPLEWWVEFGEDLARLGDLARATGQRLSMQPGQYTVLNAVDPAILENARRDLLARHRVLGAMGFGPAAKPVIHLGGVYGDRAAALARFVAAALALPPEVRSRLVVEHDDRLWSADEALAVANRTGLPVVFDRHHLRCLPGAHADYVDPAEFRRFLRVGDGITFDCMLEAKAKDRALLQLRADPAAKGITEHAPVAAADETA